MPALDPYQMQTILCLIESLIHANHIRMTEKHVEYNFYFWMVSLHAVDSTHTHAAKKIKIKINNKIENRTYIHMCICMHACTHILCKSEFSTLI